MSLTISKRFSKEPKIPDDPVGAISPCKQLSWKPFMIDLCALRQPSNVIDREARLTSWNRTFGSLTYDVDSQSNMALERTLTKIAPLR